ncbi:hypothetical protein [Actinoplanes sp. G11-F43]|uniref:hypothetical protein n=1 Tax=Actinoplanes sp. G11-F43 TaxID=3424130 RepID=UPI003D326079
MRRAILAVIAGGTLLTGAACDSGGDSGGAAAPTIVEPSATAPSPSPSVSLAPDYSADTAEVCGRIAGFRNAAFAEFGVELGRMIANKEAKETEAAKKAETAAATELKAIGTRIRKETKAAEDPGLQEAGETSAKRIEAAAKSRDYIKKLKSTKDLDDSLTDQIAEWLDPVPGYCTGGPLPSSSPSS